MKRRRPPAQRIWGDGGDDRTRKHTWCTMDYVLEENVRVLALAKQYGVNYVLIDESYDIPVDLGNLE